MTNFNNKIKNIDPEKLDNLADEKYSEGMQERTELLNKHIDFKKEQKPPFKNGDDGASSMDEEGVVSDDNVSAEEAADLERAANRMPDKDDLLDQEFLDDEDEDGTPLNEDDDFLGEDLDIGPDEEDSNIYDDNE